MPIQFSNTGGALPTGISANTIYYVANFDGNAAFFVSTSFANAMAGTVIAYTNAGSGTNTVTAALAGSYEGEYAHRQLIAEVAAHNHTVPFVSVPNILSSGGGQNLVNPGTTNTSTTGSSTPFNVTQPGTFYNLYMKL